MPLGTESVVVSGIPRKVRRWEGLAPSRVPALKDSRLEKQTAVYHAILQARTV